MSVGAIATAPEVAVRLTELAAEPAGPVHVSVYTVTPAEAGVTVKPLPVVVCAPLQPPEAVHELASRVDQASVVELPSGIDAAASVSVGTTSAASAWMNP